VVATPATCTPPQPVAEDYLAYVKEEPLQPHACESGREVYRFVGYTFHLGTEVDMLRIDVSTDGHAMLTVRRTDYAIAGTPSLIFDKSRALTDAEVAEFRKAFDASGFWSMPTEPEPTPSCVPNGVSVLEVIRDRRYHKRDRYCGGEAGTQPVFDIANKLSNSLGRSKEE
jgi:hypothetical protein